jgi:hypothetical protein
MVAKVQFQRPGEMMEDFFDSNKYELPISAKRMLPSLAVVGIACGLANSPFLSAHNVQGGAPYLVALYVALCVAVAVADITGTDIASSEDTAANHEQRNERTQARLQRAAASPLSSVATTAVAGGKVDNVTWGDDTDKATSSITTSIRPPHGSSSAITAQSGLNTPPSPSLSPTAITSASSTEQSMRSPVSQMLDATDSGIISMILGRKRRQEVLPPHLLRLKPKSVSAFLSGSTACHRRRRSFS